MLGKWRRSRQVPVGRRRSFDELLRSLSLLLEPASLEASVAARIGELTGCDVVHFCRVRSADGDLVSGTSGADGVRPAFSVSGTLVRWLKVNEEPLVIPHVQGAFEHLDEQERTSLRHAHARACVPLFAGSQIIGILLIGSSDPAWTLAREDVELLARLSRHIGLALQNLQLQLLEKERLRNLYRAEQLAVAGQLAATVAHEIKNPITAIRSSVQYALTSDAEWTVKARLLAGVLDAVDRINQKVDAVLEIGRPGAMEFADVDLVAVIEESLILTEPYARAQGLTVERQFDAVSLPVVGDRLGLQQVCINLFLNACQATDEGGRVTFCCSRSHGVDGPPYGVIQIRDTGHGIAPEHLQKIFDPFFTTKQGGTGLGLPITLDIITRHNGELSVDSEVGRGTTMTIRVKLRTA